MKNVYVINGPATSGKDTFMDIVGEYINIEKYSAIDGIKEILTKMGWNGEKTDEMRNALSDLKDFSAKHFDFPFNGIKRSYEAFLKSDAKILFICCGDPEDIERVCKQFQAQSVYIRNDRVSVTATNHADQHTENYEYDIEICNNGSLLDLRREAKKFIINMFQSKKSIELTAEDQPEFVGQFIDIFNDFLESKTGKEVCIEGTDYDTLKKEIERMLVCWSIL